MAKRLTDTEKWRRKWFRTLSPTYKCVWQFWCDNCDFAGLWLVDFEAMEFHVNDSIDLKVLEEIFGDRIVKIDSGRWFIKGFIEFQYKGKLNPKNKVHLNVITRIKKYAPGLDLSSIVDDPQTIPVSIVPDAKEEVMEEIKEEVVEEETGKGKETVFAGIKSPDELLQYWNTHLQPKGYPPAPFTMGQTMTEKFFNINKRLLAEKSTWLDYVLRVDASKFLTMIREPGKPDLTWLLSEEKFDEVYSGKYDNRDAPDDEWAKNMEKKLA